MQASKQSKVNRANQLANYAYQRLRPPSHTGREDDDDDDDDDGAQKVSLKSLKI